MDRNYDIITFFQNVFILKRPGVAIFDDIIKVVTMFIKTIFRDSWKVKRIRNYVSISVFFDIAKFADFQQKNVDVSRTQGVCHMIRIFFGFSLGRVQLCQSL